MFGISLFIDSFNSPNELFLKINLILRKITIARIIKDLMNSICKVLFAALIWWLFFWYWINFWNNFKVNLL